MSDITASGVLHRLALCNADEHYGAEYATVLLTPEMIARIRALAAEVRRLGVFKIADWDRLPDLEGQDFDGDDFRVEAVTRSVMADEVLWSGYYKWAGRWETGAIRLADLETPTPLDEAS